MIFYYSATGNSAHVARKLAKATDDQAVSMEACLQNGSCAFDLREEERIGFVTPVHFMGLPLLTERFLLALDIKTTGFPYAYSVFTFGNFSGTAPIATARALRSCGLELAASFGVRMVDTWTPIFDVSNQVKNRNIETEADARADAIAERVQAKAAGNLGVRMGPPVVDALLHAAWPRLERTGAFGVESSCTGCGRCARECPAGAIELSDGKPTWTLGHCDNCLRCLHRCPTFAIQRGANTKRHGQYVHPSASCQDG